MIVFGADTHAQELFGRFKEGHYWSGVNKDLARLAEFQGGSGSRRVEFVVDLRQARFGSSSWEEKRFERDCWIQLASRYAFAKFAQAGKIDFILPSLVSGSAFSSPHWSRIYACVDNPSRLPPSLLDIR